MNDLSVLLYDKGGKAARTLCTLADTGEVHCWHPSHAQEVKMVLVPDGCPVFLHGGTIDEFITMMRHYLPMWDKSLAQVVTLHHRGRLAVQELLALEDAA